MDYNEKPIHKVEFKNLHDFMNFDITFDGPVKFLTGKNGSGKTSVIDGMVDELTANQYGGRREVCEIEYGESGGFPYSIVHFSHEGLRDMCFSSRWCADHRCKFSEAISRLLPNLNIEICTNRDYQIRLECKFSERRIYPIDLSYGQKKIVDIFSMIYLWKRRQKIALFIDDLGSGMDVDAQRRIVPEILNCENVGFLLASSHSPLVLSNYKEYIESLG